jgi:hypothetical protein
MILRNILKSNVREFIKNNKKKTIIKFIFFQSIRFKIKNHIFIQNLVRKDTKILLDKNNLLNNKAIKIRMENKINRFRLN